MQLRIKGLLLTEIRRFSAPSESDFCFLSGGHVRIFMLKEVANFLAGTWDGRSPLLLGYSGGADSKALLYALLEIGCKTLHLAHADHGWRPESANEANALQQEAEELRIPFHIARFTRVSKGNQEAAARKSRLAFFRSLFQKFPFQALLLAHHGDDAAETALKRILEGAHLPFLGGMQPIVNLEGMAVWRPLLSIKKREVVSFLEKKKLKPLIDSTNFDPSYLRARMRMQILPDLTEKFGKRISDNLLLFSQRVAELKVYLYEKTKHFVPIRGPWGLFGFLAGLERIEARYLLQQWAEKAGIRLSRVLIEFILDAIVSNLPNRRLSQRIFVDRGCLFLLSEIFPAWGKEPLLLKPGSWRWGDWRVDVEKTIEPVPKTTWKEVWTGHFIELVPQGWLRMPSPGTHLRYLWNEEKVPAFFRYQVPVIWSEEGKLKELLTGKVLPEINPSFKLTLSTLSGTTP